MSGTAENVTGPVAKRRQGWWRSEGEAGGEGKEKAGGEGRAGGEAKAREKTETETITKTKTKTKTKTRRFYYDRKNNVFAVCRNGELHDGRRFCRCDRR